MKSTELNLDIAKAFYDRLAAGDLEAFFATLTDDVVAIAPGTRAHIPWAGTWKGRDGFGEMMATLGEAVEIELYELTRFVADGETRVLVLGRERLRVRATNRSAQSEWVHELTFRNGKVSKFVEHYDTDALATALGH